MNDELIQTIYTSGIYEMYYPESERNTSELDSYIEKMGEDLDLPEYEKDRVINLLFKACNKGQSSGFVKGFRLAMVLMNECYN